MGHPTAWMRCIELADAHLRMARNRFLRWGHDEDPQEAIQHLLQHGLFTHRIDSKRVIYLNGGTEPEQIQVNDHSEGHFDVVLEPGQAKMLYRYYVDGVFTPQAAVSILSTEREVLNALEGELARIGYDYGDQDGFKTGTEAKE